MIKLQIDWKTAPLEWCGLDKEGINDLVDRLVDYFEISKETQDKILIHIGDHFTYTYPDGNQETIIAATTPIWVNDEIERIDISLNRSFELFESKLTLYPFYEKAKAEHGLLLELTEPYEVLTWLLGEELHHANFMLGPNSTEKRMLEFLVESARFHGLNDNIEYYKTNHLPYSLNLMEVEASRAVTLFLSKVNQEKNPENAAFMKKIYFKSLEEHKAIIPCYESIMDSSFVKTGYIAR